MNRMVTVLAVLGIAILEQRMTVRSNDFSRTF